MRLLVRFLKEIEQLEVAGKTIGPFESGERAELPSWEADVFEGEGLAEVEPLSPIELKKRILAEEIDQSLQQLPPAFYEQVRHTLKDLKRKGDRIGYDQMVTQLKSLLSRRIVKLLRFVLSPEDLPELPPEEKFLVNILSPLTERWIEDVMRAGEEVTRADAEEPV